VSVVRSYFRYSVAQCQLSESGVAVCCYLFACAFNMYFLHCLLKFCDSFDRCQLPVFNKILFCTHLSAVSV